MKSEQQPGKGKTVLITGCSSGIGHNAAHGLRARGWRVFASCRSAQDVQRLKAEGFESVLIDYADEASIETGLAQVLNATGGTLDALFNNGAYGSPGAVEDLPRNAMRAIFETNLFGWHDLTARVLPVMRAQGHGRIVMNSSVLGLAVFRWRGAYVATKHALEGLTDTLRVELRGTDIKVSLIEPGPVTSKFRENSAVQFERWIDWQNSPHKQMYQDVFLKRLHEERNGKDMFELGPEAVTAKLIHAIESPRPRQRYYVTTATYLIAFLKWLLPGFAVDWVVARF